MSAGLPWCKSATWEPAVGAKASPQYKLPQMTAPPKSYPLLESIGTPADLRRLPTSRLAELAQELRQFLIQSVSTRGGHFAAGLGTVELTIALHYVYNTPYDRLVWDVGHQAYPHKVLTGRRDQLHTIKQDRGLAPFPTRSESEYDTFGVGHSSTSISAALGMAVAAAQRGEERSPPEWLSRRSTMRARCRTTCSSF
jgi:1-deoxy-D-xylulose-5-phosphate synthase